MPILVESDQGSTRVRIVGELTIYHAADSKETLLASLKQDAHIEVDLAEVAEIDLSGIQLMLMLKKEAARRRKQLLFTNHSASVRDVVDLLNLAGTLGDPMLIPGDHNG